MQTFVPSPIMTETVECLDYRRLGKQRVEALQIIKALTVPDSGWKNHPATKMWADHVPALKWYYNHCVREWVSRGYNNTMKLYPSEELEGTLPDWWGDDKVHSSHRAALLHKDHAFYSQYNWAETPALNYHWPTGVSYA